jgi:hypothetical protein
MLALHCAGTDVATVISQKARGTNAGCVRLPSVIAGDGQAIEGGTWSPKEGLEWTRGLAFPARRSNKSVQSAISEFR